MKEEEGKREQRRRRERKVNKIIKIKGIRNKLSGV